MSDWTIWPNAAYTSRTEGRPAEVRDWLIGRTIVDAYLESPDEDGQGNNLSLLLDDGTRVDVEGWGHDWWGTNVYRLPR